MYGFNKTRRLIKKTDYDHVFNKAKKVTIPEFTMLYRDNTVGHARLGLALSKKIVHKAHDRNRLKRILRETFRNHQNLPNVDMIFLARPGVNFVSNSVIMTKLSGVWNKLSASYDV